MKLDALGKRVGAIEDALGEFGRALDDNTTITRGIARQMEQMPELVELVKTYAQVKATGSVLTKVTVWGGKIAVAATAIGAAIAAALHLGGNTK